MNIYDIKIKSRSNVDISMNKYKNKIVLVVNTASKCGFTPQFKDLQDLYETTNKKGVEIVGFPCSQFKQELKTSKKANDFCKVNYGVTFPIMAMVDVNGKNQSELFKYLKGEKRGFLFTKRIKWNFTKFLVDREGKVIKRYAPSTSVSKIKSDIEKILKKENNVI